MEERQDDLTDSDRVLAGLNVDVSHARGPMPEEQFSQLIGVGAKARESAVVPAHAAVGAVFPAEIRHFHYCADENAPSKVVSSRQCGFFMKGSLRVAAQLQLLGGRREELSHRRKLKLTARQAQPNFAGPSLGKYPTD